MQDVSDYIEKNIKNFHDQRLESLSKLKLDKVLKKKNPYLFKTKNVLTANEMVQGILDAHISSSEETIFGDWLEKLAIFINQKVYNGKKSGIQGIDLEFEKNGERFIVNIKSGPNWGNSSQIQKMIDYFNKAKRTLNTSNSRINVVAVNGCCYGCDNSPYKAQGYYKYCGQSFWEFISGEDELYTKIIEPLGKRAKEENDEFKKKYSNTLNIFTKKFITKYCNKSGDIDWEKIVKHNSAK